MSSAFQLAVTKANSAKTSGERLSNDQVLRIYGLYKVATMGANRTPAPMMLDMKGKAKWQSWSNHSHLSRQQAEQQYIQLVNQLC